MEFVLASAVHLEELCRITEEARAQLKNMDLDQWQKGYPSKAVWAEDIEKQITWVAVEGRKVLGAFMFQTEPEPSYAKIDGAWLTDGPYASLHRVCVAEASRGKGVVGQMIRYSFELVKQAGVPSMRIDTHEGNQPMKRALEKAGFTPCGTIILKGGSEDGDPRLAFERKL